MAHRAAGMRETRRKRAVDKKGTAYSQLAKALPKATFLKHITIPEDDEDFSAECFVGVTLKKTWLVKNSGAQMWPSGTQLHCVEGSLTPVDLLSELHNGGGLGTPVRKGSRGDEDDAGPGGWGGQWADGTTHAWATPGDDNNNSINNDNSSRLHPSRPLRRLDSADSQPSDERGEWGRGSNSSGGGGSGLARRGTWGSNASGDSRGSPRHQTDGNGKGSVLVAVDDVPRPMPGNVLHLSTDVQVPASKGRHLGVYRLCTADGRYFGPALTVKVFARHFTDEEDLEEQLADEEELREQMGRMTPPPGESVDLSDGMLPPSQQQGGQWQPGMLAQQAAPPRTLMEQQQQQQQQRVVKWASPSSQQSDQATVSPARSTGTWAEQQQQQQQREDVAGQAAVQGWADLLAQTGAIKDWGAYDEDDGSAQQGGGGVPLPMQSAFSEAQSEAQSATSAFSNLELSPPIGPLVGPQLSPNLSPLHSPKSGPANGPVYAVRPPRKHASPPEPLGFSRTSQFMTNVQQQQQYNRQQQSLSASSELDEARRREDEISVSDIRFGIKIGEGVYGEVFQGTLWGQPVALKKLRPSRFRGNMDDFEKEVRIMQNLRHPNIVVFLGACWAKGRCCMVTEYVPNGSLETLMQKYRVRRKQMSLKRIIKFNLDIARGLNWLHHKHIIHRDLKTENVLVGLNDTLKIADFGLAHLKTRRDANATGFYGVCGTPCYMAPEVLRKDQYNSKADVFSFGMMLCEMVIGEYPFERTSAGAPSKSDAFDEAIIAGLRPPIPDKCQPEIRALIEQCWSADPASRPAMDEVVVRLEALQRKQLAVAKDILEEVDDEVNALFEEQQRRIGEMEAELKTARRKVRSAEQQLGAERREKSNLMRQVATLRKQVETLSAAKERGGWSSEPASGHNTRANRRRGGSSGGNSGPRDVKSARNLFTQQQASKQQWEDQEPSALSRRRQSRMKKMEKAGQKYNKGKAKSRRKVKKAQLLKQ